jgi:predicted nucleotide-binding protein
VILELGFFIGALGRSRVAMLYQEGVERPSDIDGVLVQPLDSGGGWKAKLAREMSSVGVAIDAAAVIRA